MAEVNLGTVFNNTTLRRRDSVGGTDTVDTFSFRTVPFGNGDNSNINISLTGMTGDADVRVFRDFNANGIVDGNDRLLASSTRGSFNDESINLSALASGVDAGNYVVEVKPFGSARTSYDLKVSASALVSGNSPSLLLPSEIEVGALTSRRSFSGSVGTSNTVDTYRFNVTSSRTFNFFANGSSLSGVDMRLIQDGNNNREVDVFAGEELARSQPAIGGGESISRNLAPGTYYLQVYNAFSSNNYTLTMG